MRGRTYNFGLAGWLNENWGWSARFLLGVGSWEPGYRDPPPQHYVQVFARYRTDWGTIIGIGGGHDVNRQWTQLPGTLFELAQDVPLRNAFDLRVGVTGFYIRQFTPAVVLVWRL